MLLTRNAYYRFVCIVGEAVHLNQFKRLAI